MSFYKKIFVFLSCLGSLVGLAQPKIEFQLKKPTKYEDRELGSEKKTDKKFTFIRRVVQNTYTHYNYFFNANQLIKEIVSKAREGQKDDYTALLPFYPWSINQTKYSGDIDSILQKCTAGILLHDLRNDWIDNMYLLMGKAYYLRGDFDSASMAFQFLNFSYAPKEKGGFDQPIGSNANNGTNAFTISTKEKYNPLKRPPSRNDAFLWQVKNLIEKGDFIDASSLIETLKNDPNFPDRLRYEMYEASAYLYYKVQSWDSAAVYLEKAIPAAEQAEDKPRWWYLCGQLYQLQGNYAAASRAFANCTQSAIDPIMEVYARLNSIRLNKGEDPSLIDKNIASLLNMAKKDKYSSYKDIIFYAAALIEMERNGYKDAEKYLVKSLEANQNNNEQRGRIFLLMGDLFFQTKQYGKAAMPYDSAKAARLKPDQMTRIDQRQPGCKEVFDADIVIYLQDSLLSLAAMPEDQRSALVKKLSKQLKKKMGVKEEDEPMGTGAIIDKPNNKELVNLFSSSSGNWYFYDPTIRANGFTTFRQRWGARPNIDNWRRTSAIGLAKPKKAESSDPDGGDIVANPVGQAEEVFDSTDVSFDNLYSRIPLSAARKQLVEDKLINALYAKGKALHEAIEDYPEAIKVFEAMLLRLDTGSLAEDARFALRHCYYQLGDSAGVSKYNNRQNSSKTITKSSSPQQLQDNLYQPIYNLFIEGRFEEALALRKETDSLLGNGYWTPQLLYIQAVYHIQAKQDSLAIVQLNQLAERFSGQPLADKAVVMKDVLGRRKEIETYLQQLEITKMDEEVVYIPTPNQFIAQAAPLLSEELLKRMDSVRRADSTAYALTKKLEIEQNRKDSLAAVAKGKKAFKQYQDSMVLVRKIQLQNHVKDSLANLALRQLENERAGINTPPSFVLKQPITPSPYLLRADEPQVVAIVLQKVDPAYVNEALYSLNNATIKNHLGKEVTLIKQKLKDGLWLIALRSTTFTNMEASFEYINYLQPLLRSKLLTWLEPSKYSMITISEANLLLLAQDLNMELYQKICSEALPVKW